MQMENDTLTESLMEGKVNEQLVLLDEHNPRPSINPTETVLVKGKHIRGHRRFDSLDLRENIILRTIVNISIKSIGNVDVVDMTADIRYTLAIFCDVKGLDEEKRNYVRDNLSVFLDDVEMDLQKARRKINDDGVITIIYRGVGQNYFQLRRRYLRYLPFDHHWMNIKFTLSDIDHDFKENENFVHLVLKENELEKAKSENKCVYIVLKENELGNAKSVNKCVYRFDCLICPDINKMVQYRPHYDRIPEWNIAINETEVDLQMETKKEFGGNKISYNPEIIIRILLYREPGYLIYIVMLPLLILNLCTLAVYGLGADSYSDKLSILVTLLLAMFAFIPTIRASIPKVPFITILDVQVLFSITLIFAGVMETVINGLFTEDGAGLIIKYVFVAISAFVIFISICVNGLFWYPYKKKCLEYREESKKIVNNFEKKAAYSPDFWDIYDSQDFKQKEKKEDYGFLYLWGLSDLWCSSGTKIVKKV